MEYFKEIEERVILVGVQMNDGEDTEESLEELSELAKTAGAQTVGTIIQNREAVHPGTYIGKGKIEDCLLYTSTFFKTSIPDSVIESAKIDGASEWKLFFKIVIPMALPGLATIGLFLTLGYWNDWFNACLLYTSRCV